MSAGFSIARIALICVTTVALGVAIGWAWPTWQAVALLPLVWIMALALHDEISPVLERIFRNDKKD